MGDIGPQRRHLEVLPSRSETLELRVPEPEPFPVPSPEPVPQPDPVPNPDPVPQPPNGARG